ncbi:hypothetical protein J6590_048762 [Homalodisca vitripennis]|nr:hypothetical protein J6590_048762 [Homalodisca vitripennis]
MSSNMISGTIYHRFSFYTSGQWRKQDLVWRDMSMIEDHTIQEVYIPTPPLDYATGYGLPVIPSRVVIKLSIVELQQWFTDGSKIESIAGGRITELTMQGMLIPMGPYPKAF